MLYIYDTLSRTKIPFKPVEPGRVRMYVCGMTVYDYCHLGHARMLVSFDVVQRWLRASGLQVQYVRNITDIDDKIIQGARARHCRLKDLTAFFIAAMHADERALGVQPPDQAPRATDYVSTMLTIIDTLKDRGLAYQASDGDVNFSVRRFPGYGKLSGKSIDDLRVGARVAEGTAKRDPLDFALWKTAKANEPADSTWPSPYGLGRPGWHIECSAMSQSLLGLPLDIHGGGPDLRFPHHENEIAQTEGAFGGTLAQVWMHCGPLMVHADKMSKSLNNFRTIRQTIGQPASDAEATTGTLASPSADAGLDVRHADYVFNPREAEMLRFFIVRSHYRSPQNYTWDNLVDAQNALDRLYQALANVKGGIQTGGGAATAQAQHVTADVRPIDWSTPQAQAFKAAMDDDFNTPAAIAVLFQLAAQINKSSHASNVKNAPDFSTRSVAQLKALAGLLGLLQQNPHAYLRTSTRYTAAEKSTVATEILDEAAIDALIVARTHAKRERNFAEADRIRSVLRNANIELEDKPGGATDWRRC